jgi:hypothetical protein
MQWQIKERRDVKRRFFFLVGSYGYYSVSSSFIGLTPPTCSTMFGMTSVRYDSQRMIVLDNGNYSKMYLCHHLRLLLKPFLDKDVSMLFLGADDKGNIWLPLDSASSHTAKTL